MGETKQTAGGKSKQDYSELPQKPITLKEGIGGLAGPVGKNSSDAEFLSPPVPKQKKNISVKKKRAAASQWTLRGVSITAREAATMAARDEGLKLNEWLERAIYQAVSASSKQGDADKQVLDTLADIRNRLERIEQRHGFLNRFWLYIKSWTD